MRLFHIGDVVGAAGCNFLCEKLPVLKRLKGVDVTVVNGENSAQGNGITKRSMEQIFTAGADVITTGNHCFQRREALAIYENPTVLRPANYPEGCPGRGACTLDFGSWQFAVINLCGTAFMDPLDNPFSVIDTVLPTLSTPNILLDFHAESTAEKKAMGYYLAGRVTAVVGTHTHVQTADEAIFADHTGYLTDVGMTGPEHSVLGIAIRPATDRLRFHFAERFVEAKGNCLLCGVFVDFDEKSGKCFHIERIIVS